MQGNVCLEYKSGIVEVPGSRRAFKWLDFAVGRLSVMIAEPAATEVYALYLEKKVTSVFRCQMCGKVAAPGTKAERVTVASRPKEYKAKVEPGGPRRFSRFREPPKPRDRGGRGYEIVKELQVCSTCGAAHKEQQKAIEAAAKAAAMQFGRDDMDDNMGEDDDT